MGKSRKKTPIVKDNCKGMKRFANKAVRHADVSDGANYKKVFNSYDIHDWKSNFLRAYDRHGRPKSRWAAELTEKILREFWNK